MTKDSVYYHDEDKKSQRGPLKAISDIGRNVFAMANGNIEKVADFKVQPYGRDKEE